MAHRRWRKAGSAVHPLNWLHPAAVPIAQWILELEEEPDPQEVKSRMRKALGDDFIHFERVILDDSDESE